jgi:uncharacterized protein (DUF433 family)
LHDRDTAAASNFGDSMDWQQCGFVEAVPGKQGGMPVLKGTSFPADTVVLNYDYGLTANEIAKVFRLDFTQVLGVLEHMRKQRTPDCNHHERLQ